MSAPTEWVVLSRAQSDNWGKWKITARKGSLVLHEGRLTEDEARNFTPADCAAAWHRQTIGS